MAGGGGGDDDELVPSRLDIRVGKIISVEKVGRLDLLMADQIVGLWFEQSLLSLWSRDFLCRPASRC